MRENSLNHSNNEKIYLLTIFRYYILIFACLWNFVERIFTAKKIGKVLIQDNDHGNSEIYLPSLLRVLESRWRHRSQTSGSRNRWGGQEVNCRKERWIAIRHCSWRPCEGMWTWWNFLSKNATLTPKNSADMWTQTSFICHLVTPLWLAAVLNKLEVLNSLINLGANINAASHRGSTPVLAACSENVDVVKCLIKHGADVKRTNDRGESCLMMAVQVEQGDLSDPYR